jgi:hypothetical protein
MNEEELLCNLTNTTLQSSTKNVKKRKKKKWPEFFYVLICYKSQQKRSKFHYQEMLIRISLNKDYEGLKFLIIIFLIVNTVVGIMYLLFNDWLNIYKTST